MQQLKEDIIKILVEKNNSISNKLIENIELFELPELEELKLILEQTCTKRLKEAAEYKNTQLNSTLDKITEIWTRVYELDREYKQKLIENTIAYDYEDIEKDIEISLEKAYVS